MANNEFKKEDEQLEQVESTLGKAGQWVVDHQNVLMYTLLGVVVAIMAGYLYVHKVMKPKQDQAAMEVAAADKLFMMGDTLKAIEGDGNTTIGYIEIVNKYHNQQGELAALKLASIYYDQANYEEAVKYAKKFDSKDMTIGPAANQLLGDAYVALENYKEAVSAYKKAIKSENEMIAPMSLYKLALVYVAMEKTEDAKQALESIKKAYPQSAQVVLADAMLLTLE